MLRKDWAQLKASLSPDVVFQELDGETVLLDMQSGYYYGLDAVSTTIWKKLAAGESLSSIFDALLAEYDVSKEQCRQDMMTFLVQLEQKKLITFYNDEHETD